MSGIARLWDQHFTWIAAEPCPDPEIRQGEFAVTVSGRGPLYDAAKALICQELNLHLTFDQNPDLDWRTRIGGKVTKLEVVERDCECGQNRIITTTIHAAMPLPYPWPTP